MGHQSGGGEAQHDRPAHAAAEQQPRDFQRQRHGVAGGETDGADAGEHRAYAPTNGNLAVALATWIVTCAEWKHLYTASWLRKVEA